MTKIGSKQMEIFRYIRSFIESHGYPPTVREIGADFGMKSPSTIYFHLKKLAEAGLIDMPPGKTRAITILQDPTPHRGQVPVVSRVLIGGPIPSEDDIEEYIPFQGDDDEEYFALRVQSDSMKDIGVLPGDMAVILRGERSQPGQTVAALVEEQIKFLPAERTDAPIIGQVVQLIRRY